MSATTRERYSNSARRPQDGNQAGGNLTGKVLVLFIIVILGAIAFAVVRLVQAQGNQKITAETATVEQVSDDHLKLWIDVTRKDTTIPGYCIVTALNYDRGEIGRREIVIPAGGEDLQRVEIDITTTEPAASGDVYGCSNNIPFYLDVPKS